MATSAKRTREDYCVGAHFFLDPFAERQWDDADKYKGGRITASKAEFTARVNALYEEGGKELVGGYAPFCKHVFVPAFVDLPVQAVAITEENKGLVRSAYIRRTEKEIPVLARWIEAADLKEGVPNAKFLDIILYSRDQIVAERCEQTHTNPLTHSLTRSPPLQSFPPSLPHSLTHKLGLPLFILWFFRVAQGDAKEEVEAELPERPWGIISIKAQDENSEIPMQPITMMRNALGKEEGGSGVPLHREKYQQSVDYWNRHVTIQG